MDPHVVEHKRVLVHSIYWPIIIPVNSKPFATAVVMHLSGSNVYIHFACSWLRDCNLLSFFTTDAEVARIHAHEYDEAYQTDGPQAAEHVSEIMIAAAYSGNAANKPRDQCNDRNAEEEQQCQPCKCILPESFQYKFFKRKHQESTEQQAH